MVSLSNKLDKRVYMMCLSAYIWFKKNPWYRSQQLSVNNYTEITFNPMTQIKKNPIVVCQPRNRF